MWASPCVHYRGPRNVGLCRDTKVGERITPDSASSQVLENALVWRTEASPCDLQPKGRERMKSKFPLRNNSIRILIITDVIITYCAVFKCLFH